jgi:hypothetical protein
MHSTQTTTAPPKQLTFDEKLDLVLRQTNYTEEEAKEKLALTENDPEAVIRMYLGLPVKKEKKGTKAKAASKA